jgi:hypothetical protein
MKVAAEDNKYNKRKVAAEDNKCNWRPGKEFSLDQAKAERSSLSSTLGR